MIKIKREATGSAGSAMRRRPQGALLSYETLKEIIDDPGSACIIWPAVWLLYTACSMQKITRGGNHGYQVGH
jgi:hypothetical protein